MSRNLKMRRVDGSGSTEKTAFLYSSSVRERRHIVKLFRMALLVTGAEMYLLSLE